MASKIAANSPLVVQGVKKVMDYAEDHTVEDGLKMVGLWNTSFFRSDDLTEALLAFMDKRTPVFKYGDGYGDDGDGDVMVLMVMLWLHS